MCERWGYRQLKSHRQMAEHVKPNNLAFSVFATDPQRNNKYGLAFL